MAGLTNMAWLAGLTKRYRSDCLSADILQATADKEAYPTRLVAEASELNK